MYPLAKGMFAAKNQWYVAAWSDEVTRDPMERWILDEPVAFYRREDGRPVALDGRCPHRSFPLGKSTVIGDDIKCGYHGLRFGPDGQCTLIPSQDHIPRVCKVRSYPVVERWKWIWIWPGDPELADESLLPDHFEIGLTNPDYTIMSSDYRFVNGRYMLLHDNLFDLTHVSHLHAKTIGAGTPSDNDVVPDHLEGPNWIESRYETKNLPIPVIAEKMFGYKGNVNRVFGLRFHMPCLHAGVDSTYKTDENGEAGELLGSVLGFVDKGHP